MTLSASYPRPHPGDGGPPAAEGFLHEMGVYGSDEEFRDLILPFTFGGLEAGEPVVFAYDPYKMELLQRWLPEAPGISYVNETSPYATPTRALVSWRKVVENHLAAGAPRVRIAGDVPHPGYGSPYAGWDRYEAAVDRALGDLPVWAPCLYDARIAPTEVVETAVRRHRLLLDGNGTHRANESFESPRRLADFLPPPPDPLEETLPTLELVDPTPSAVRAAVNQLADGWLSVDQHQNLILAASEAVANASIHGAPPVTVRIWRGEDRLVVNVHDEGRGPPDPLAGLLPTGNGAESGRGLWLTHQLDIDVALAAAHKGFTVRLRAGSL